MSRQHTYRSSNHDNLVDFFTRMRARGFEVTHTSEDGVEDLTNLDDVASWAANREDCRVRLHNSESNYGQSVYVLYTGDSWCDVVPIYNWTIPRDSPDVVDIVISEIRDEILGEDA